MQRYYIKKNFKSKITFVSDKWNVTGLEKNVIFCMVPGLFPYLFVISFYNLSSTIYCAVINTESAIFTYNAMCYIWIV